MTMWPDYDISALRAAREQRAQDFMRGRRLDHLLLTGFDSIRYVLDARFQMISEGWDWFTALVDESGGEVFVPWVDEDSYLPDPDAPAVRATHPLPSWITPVAQAVYWSDTIAQALVRTKARRVGYDHLDLSLADALRERLPSVTFESVGRALLELRAPKLPIEIELLEATAAVSCAAANAALAAVEAGMTDYDVLSQVMASLQARASMSPSPFATPAGHPDGSHKGRCCEKATPSSSTSVATAWVVTLLTSRERVLSASHPGRCRAPTPGCSRHTTSARTLPDRDGKSARCTPRSTRIYWHTISRRPRTASGMGWACARASCRRYRGGIGWVEKMRLSKG